MAHRFTLWICLAFAGLTVVSAVFGSAPPPPSVLTESLGDADVGVSSVALRATVNTYGQSASVKFKYWPQSSPLANFETPSQTIVSDGPASVVANVNGFKENTAWAYVAIATVGGVEVHGSVVEFTTDVNLAPVAVPHIVFYTGSTVVDPFGPDGDYDPNTPPDPLSIEVLDFPPGAQLLVGTNISYSPQSTTADASLTYRIFDLHGGSAIGTIRFIEFRSRDGFYDGSFHDAASGRDGRVSVSLTATGVVSLESRFSWSGGGTQRVKGFFDSHGRLALTVKSDRANANSTDLTLSLALDPDSPVIRATVVERDGAGAILTSIPEFVLNRNASTGGNLAPGLRTSFLKVPANLADLAAATADGFLSLKIGTDKYRRARIAGRMPDGEPFLAGVAASGRTYPLSRKLEKRGALAGLVRILEPTAAGAGGMIGQLAWKKPANASAQYYRGGIDTVLALEGVDYAVDPAGLPSIGLGAANAVSGNARLHFAGGNLVGTYRDVLVNFLPKTAQLIGPDPQQAGSDLDLRKLTLKANAANGTFTGHFLHPQTHKIVSFAGGFRAPFDTEGGAGRGLFRSQRVVGSITIEPNAP